MASEAQSTSTEKKKPDFAPEINLFINHLNAIAIVMAGAVVSISKLQNEAGKQAIRFVDECSVLDEDGKNLKINIPLPRYREFKRIFAQSERLSLATSLMPRSLLVSLVSQYDAYLGRLLRTIFLRKPEILNSSERKVTFESLSQFSSIESIREAILEKEVESILRSSHVEQFKWMESSFGLTLIKGIERWHEFVEITERRNLFVHTDGVVSSQYLAVCRNHGCKFSNDVKEGIRLEAPTEYFSAANECIFEIGMKLGHVLWRKLFPEEREKADDSLIHNTFELIENGRYKLAIRILDFAADSIKKFSNEVRQLILVVNRAQAYKWIGNEAYCKEIMQTVDWSAKSDNFQLANAVLADDWINAARIMKRIGPEGSVQQLHYLEWPLFRNFRNQEIFNKTYREVFGMDVTVSSESDDPEEPTPLQIHLLDKSDAPTDESKSN